MRAEQTSRQWYLRHGQLDRVAEVDRQLAEFGALGSRAFNAILRAGFKTGGEVQWTADEHLLGVRTLGLTTLAEIRAVLPYVSPYADGAW